MRYFFQAEDGRCYPDDHGTELSDLREACIEASKVLGDFLREKPKEFWADDSLSLKVSDDTGLVLFTLNLSVTLSAALGSRYPVID